MEVRVENVNKQLKSADIFDTIKVCVHTQVDQNDLLLLNSFEEKDSPPKAKPDLSNFWKKRLKILTGNKIFKNIQSLKDIPRAVHDCFCNAPHKCIHLAFFDKKKSYLRKHFSNLNIKTPCPWHLNL